MAVVGFFLSLLLASPARAEAVEPFDYYVLVLSWSPTYCAGTSASAEPLQCSPGRRFAFVLHGLWPQYEQGWPSNCPTGESWVPREVIDGMLDVMPSKNLVIHEWRKHGSCSGLPMRDYFDLSRRLFSSVRVPARYLSPQAPIETTPAGLVRDFVKTNRDLTAAMISVQCGNARDRARLSELRICLDRDGEPTACGANENRQCRASRLVLPPVR